MAGNNEERIRFANHEILGKGDLSVVEEVFASDYVLHAGGKEHKGPPFVRRFVERLRAALPNLRVVEVEVLMQAADTVAWQRTLRGTHEADLMGIPPTNKKVEWRDILVTRFVGGKIAEEWAVSDLAGQLFAKFPHA